MYTVRLTLEFQDWLDGVGDQRAQVRIVARLRRAGLGNIKRAQRIARELEHES